MNQNFTIRCNFIITGRLELLAGNLDQGVADRTRTSESVGRLYMRHKRCFAIKRSSFWLDRSSASEVSPRRAEWNPFSTESKHLASILRKGAQYDC